MYATERARVIRQYLEEHGQAHVHQLSAMLGVSEVTVRRDLERLEARGFLTRTHGGAVLNERAGAGEIAALVTSPVDEHLDEIATVALHMVGDGDVVMLTNGATSTRIAQRLEARSGLTVLTNDVTIALSVSVQQTNRVVMLGGDVVAQERAVFGSMALSNLQRFYVNRLFVEVDGINDRLEVSVNSQEKADLILGAIDVAKETILVCPAERFARNAFYRLGSVQMAQRVITNTFVEENYKTALFAHDIPIYTSVAAFEGSA